MYQRKETVFGRRLREKRKEKGLTQAELARRVKAKRHMITNYELRGQTPRDQDLLLRLAQVLDTTADYLLGDDNNENQTNQYKEIYDLEKIKSVFSKLEFTVNGESLPNTDQELIKSVMEPILDRIINDKKNMDDS